jgi:hypothetical protein
MARTEFYESAVKAGFYGIERSGLFGKKDNVRKYWEDVFLKTTVRPSLETLFATSDRLRIVDLGAGSGEGLELLTHVPLPQPLQSSRPFLLTEDRLETYEGIDSSPAMVAQGQQNYQGKNHVKFVQADLSAGFPLRAEPPFQVYFSSYGSLSHLTAEELERLSAQIFAHAQNGSILVYDVLGRFSPEWPMYWNRSAREQLPYNMGYLLPPQEQDPQRVESFHVTYWTAPELLDTVRRAAAASGTHARILAIKDRSILVGRHMGTCFFKPVRFDVRNQVNHLFDRDYQGETAGLMVPLDYLAAAPLRVGDGDRSVAREADLRLRHYHSSWSVVIRTLEALRRTDNASVRQLIESSPDALAEDLKMLAWLYRNADRFPVLDFWASVMGPQVACVLRNLELNLPDGLGCGHSLLCIVEICK